MKNVEVMAAPGRIVPRSVGGRAVPSGRFVLIPLTPWIAKRIADGDLIVRPAPVSAAGVRPAAEPVEVHPVAEPVEVVVGEDAAEEKEDFDRLRPSKRR